MTNFIDSKFILKSKTILASLGSLIPTAIIAVHYAQTLPLPVTWLAGLASVSSALAIVSRYVAKKDLNLIPQV